MRAEVERSVEYEDESRIRPVSIDTLLCPWVGRPIHLDQPRRLEVRVTLRRAEAGMAQQLLNAAERGAALQQRRGEGVAQRVRTDSGPCAAHGHVPPHEAVHAAA